MRIAAVVLVGLVAGCGAQGPIPAVVDVGVHRVSFVIPSGWQHYDHGREHRLETSDGDIVLADFGPVTSEGYADVVRQARELYQRGQLDDARQRLRIVETGFGITDPALRASLVADLDPILREQPLPIAEAAFDSFLDGLDRLPPMDLGWLAKEVLLDLDHGPRRDIEREERLVIDGRQARRILTWQRLTHDFRRRHVFVVHRGSLLVIRTDMGLDEVLGPAFKIVVRSLVFVDPDAH